MFGNHDEFGCSFQPKEMSIQTDSPVSIWPLICLSISLYLKNKFANNAFIFYLFSPALSGIIFFLELASTDLNPLYLGVQLNI